MKLILNNEKTIEGKLYKQLDDGVKLLHFRMMPFNNSTCLFDDHPDEWIMSNVIETFRYKDIKEIIE